MHLPRGVTHLFSLPSACRRPGEDRRKPHAEEQGQNFPGAGLVTSEKRILESSWD